MEDLLRLLTAPSPDRAQGTHEAQPLLLCGEAGAGKTWALEHVLFKVATLSTPDLGSVRLVPVLISVARLAKWVRDGAGAAGTATPEGGAQWGLLDYVAHDDALRPWANMLSHCYRLRALVVLLDGVDEAGDCREAIDEFVLCRLLPSGNRLVCTSRPEGVRRDLYAWRFVVVDLEPLTNDQLCDAIEMLDADPERVFDKLIDAQVRENVPSPPRTFPL